MLSAPTALSGLFTGPSRDLESLSQLLPWFGALNDSIVLCKDGSLLAGFAFEGSDVEGLTDDDVNRRIDVFEVALRQLNDRITLYTIQDRRFDTTYQVGEYTNEIARAVDEQWGQGLVSRPHGRFKHRIYLGFSFPSRSEALLEALKSEIDEHDGNVFRALGALAKRRLTDGGAISRVRGQLQDMVVEFEAIIGAFAGIVVEQLGFVRLKDEWLFGDLASRANLASEIGQVKLRNLHSHLDTALMADRITRKHSQLQFANNTSERYASFITTTGMPPAAYSFDLDRLMAENIEYSIIQSFSFVDSAVATAAIQSAAQFYKDEVKSIITRTFERLTGVESDKVNLGNLALAEDANQALYDMTAGDLAYGYYNMTVIALGRTVNECRHAAATVKKTLASRGFLLIDEDYGLRSAFVGSLPGGSKSLQRKFLASTQNLADLAPIRTVSRGDTNHPLFESLLQRYTQPHAMFHTPYGVPYGFNFHADDLGHTVVIGGPGSGKTSFMQAMITLFQKYTPCQTFIFDKDYSMYLATLMLGGKHIDMNPSGTRAPRMNPVARMLKAGDKIALVKWIGVLLGAGGQDVSGDDYEALNNAIQESMELGEQAWRLGTLYQLLASRRPSLASKLAPYVDRSNGESSFNRGMFSKYFDNEVDDFSLSSFVGMECGGLLGVEEIASPFMDYAFYCISSMLDGHTPTMIYVEEAWYMLANPAFASKMDDWLRTFRKKKAFIVFATQSIDELTRLEGLAAFIVSVPTRIFLRSLNDSVAATAHLYTSVFSLNEQQLALLSSALPKRDYLIVKPGVTRLVNASMPPILLAINQGTSRADVRHVAQEMAESGEPNWQQRFLKEVLHVRF